MIGVRQDGADEFGVDISHKAHDIWNHAESFTPSMRCTGHPKDMRVNEFGVTYSLGIQGQPSETGTALCLIRFTPVSRHLWYLEFFLPT